MIKTAWYWHKNREVDVGNRIENQEMNPATYRYLIFDNQIKNIQWGNDSPFNKWGWVNWLAICRRPKLDPHLSPLTKIDSHWIKDLNLRHETIKILEESAGKTLEGIGLGEYFMRKTPQEIEVVSKIHYWDLIKLKTSAQPRT